MVKGLAPVFFTACGVVVAGVAGYSIFESQSSINKAQNQSAIASPSQTEDSELEQEVAKLDPRPEEPLKNSEIQSSPKPEAPVEPIVESIEVLPVKPSFGLVRVERYGSAVIAGEGPANQVIELIDGRERLAETRVNAAGEFVFVLDEPLAPGAHELFLRVMPEEGDPVLSSSFAFVDVPKPKTIGEVTVLLAEAGKPSQLLQKPLSPSAEDKTKPENNIVTATAQSKITLAEPEDTNGSEEYSGEEEKQASLDKTKKADVQKPKPTEVSSLASVLIEAADVEDGKIFIAGTGEPLTIINIYLDNDLLGSTQVAENGAFLFEGSAKLEPGRYDIRADMTKSGASVLTRAEVTLVHEPKAILDAPKEEPKIEIAKAEPKVDPESALEPEIKPAKEPTAATNENVGTEDNVEAKIETEDAIEIEQNASVQEPEPQETEDTLEVKTETGEMETAAGLKAEKKEIQTGSAVIIRRGDNLWTVARRNYGAGIRYTTIFDANRDQVRDPHKIYPGQVLKIPESEQSTE